MDKLMQGIDDETGRPYVLFGKVKVETLPGGRWRVVDKREGRALEFDDKAAALAAAGITEAEFEGATTPAEAAIVSVRVLLSSVELASLDHICREHQLTREAAIRRAVAEYIVQNLRG